MTERRIQEIIPNQWYPIITSAELGAKPLGLRRLNTDVVAWRDGDGAAVVQHAACPHRGANLGLGRITDGCIECPYHGFRFRSDGSCDGAPCEGDGATLRRDLRAHTYPSREAHGVVWMWHGDEEPTADLPWFDHFDHDGPRVCSTTLEWDVSLSRCVEGMIDMHHFPFAHRHLSGGVGSLLDPFEAEEIDGVVHTRGTLRRPDQDPSKGFAMDFRVQLPAVISVQLTPKLIGVVLLCPVSDERTWGVVYYRQDWVTMPLLGTFLTWLSLTFEMRFVQTDDEKMLLSSEPTNSHPRVNRYVRADAGIAMWHRLKARALEDAQ